MYDVWMAIWPALQGVLIFFGVSFILFIYWAFRSIQTDPKDEYREALRGAHTPLEKKAAEARFAERVGYPEAMIERLRDDLK